METLIIIFLWEQVKAAVGQSSRFGSIIHVLIRLLPLIMAQTASWRQIFTQKSDPMTSGGLPSTSYNSNLTNIVFYYYLSKTATLTSVDLVRTEEVLQYNY